MERAEDGGWEGEFGKGITVKHIDRTVCHVQGSLDAFEMHEKIVLKNAKRVTRRMVAFC